MKTHKSCIKSINEKTGGGSLNLRPFCVYGYWMESFNALPALNTGSLAAGISTVSLVRGLRPVRASRFFTSKEPKPTNCTLSPAFIASASVSVRAPSAASQSFWTGRTFRPWPTPIPPYPCKNILSMKITGSLYIYLDYTAR